MFLCCCWSCVAHTPCWTLVHHVLLNTACPPPFRCQALKHPGELPLRDQALWLWSERTAHRLHGQLFCGNPLVYVGEFALSCSPLLSIIRTAACRLQIYVLGGVRADSRLCGAEAQISWYWRFAEAQVNRATSFKCRLSVRGGWEQRLWSNELRHDVMILQKHNNMTDMCGLHIFNT